MTEMRRVDLYVQKIGMLEKMFFIEIFTNIYEEKHTCTSYIYLTTELLTCEWYFRWYHVSVTSTYTDDNFGAQCRKFPPNLGP